MTSLLDLHDQQSSIAQFPYLRSSDYENLSEEELESLVDGLISQIRSYGFPYHPTNESWRRRELSRLQKTKYTELIKGKVIEQSMLGLGLAWSFMPHSYEVKCRGMRGSAMDAFNSDDVLRRILWKRIRSGYSVCDWAVRKLVKITSGFQGVSNFRPTAAACVYELLGMQGGHVWDMSGGYGGRMLGAVLAGVGKYTCTDPCELTYKGLSALAEFLELDSEVIKIGSEDYQPVLGEFDGCFTSPPYFNLEMYSEEGTQSWVKFPKPDSWLHGFLRPTFENAYFGLKPRGKMAINIANVRTFPDLEEQAVKAAKSVGFELYDQYALRLSSYSKGSKTEPIFFFRKLR